MTTFVLNEKYNPEGSQLRKAQLRMLDLLVFIDEVCRKNDIPYWLDSGTLLGAMRHGGFIPWDDDADICILRSDAERLKKIMMTEYQDVDYILQCDETDPHAYCPWLVLRDMKSEYLQDSEVHRNRKYRGLQVDIFVLDDNVNDFLQKISWKMFRALVWAPFEGGAFRIFRPFVWLNYKLLTKVVFPLFRAVSGGRKDYYKFSYGSPFRSVRYKKDIYPLTRIGFEGREFNAPADSSSYLTTIYGNWERIPDPDMIVTHEVEVRFYE